MAITNLNIPTGIDDDELPFGFMESSENIVRGQKECFEKLPDDLKSRVRDFFEGDGLPDTDEARSLVKNPERILKECPDGQIWFSMEDKSSGFETIVRMNPVLFALYAGEYKAADRLLSIKGFNDLKKYDQVEFLSVKRSSEDGTYLLSEREVFDERDYYKFGIGKYLYGTRDEKALPVIYKFFKCLDKDGCIFGINPPGNARYPVMTDNGGRLYVGGDIFGFIPNDNIYDPFLNLLEYISDRDKVLFSRMVSNDMFTEMLLYYCSHRIPFSKNSNLQTLKKIYRSSGMELTPGDIWDEIILRVLNRDFCNFGYEEHTDEIGKCFEKITGKQLVCNANDLGTALDAPEITGELLETLIRVAHHAVYKEGGETAGKVSFDLGGLIEYGGEELIRTALKKDFITMEACDDLLKKARSVNKCSLIPLLVLKKYGEWPPFEENEGVCDGKKKIQKRTDPR